MLVRGADCFYLMQYSSHLQRYHIFHVERISLENFITHPTHPHPVKRAQRMKVIKQDSSTTNTHKHWKHSYENEREKILI